MSDAFRQARDKRASLRVLLVSASHPPTPCGVGDYTFRLANALAERPGVSTAILTTRLPNLLQHSQAASRCIGAVKDWKLKYIPRAIRVIGRWRPDVVHIQYPAQGYGTAGMISGLALLIRWHLRVPLLVTLHEHIESRWLFELPMIAAAREFVVVREQFRKDVCGGFGWLINNKRFHLIPNASNLPRMERTPEVVATVRRELGAGAKPIVAYFGFIQPPRGIELLFEIADPRKHFLVIVGGRLTPFEDYYDKLVAKSREASWNGSALLTGFLPETKAAMVLAAADAVVLPFHAGVGSWSTSLHAAILQGTFVLSTSHDRRGYDPDTNVCYVPPGDIEQLRRALADHLGTRCAGTERPSPSWPSIAAQHEMIYRQLQPTVPRKEAA